MQRINTIYDIYGQPFVIVKNEVIIEISRYFTDMTEYTDGELLNSNIKDLFKTLRVGPNVDTDNIDEQTECFLFTKSLEVKLVNIQIIQTVQGEVYVFLEKPDLNLEFNFPFANMLYAGNYYGIGIYSAPDKILLKANDKYISFFEKPYNKKKNCIGKHVSEFTTGFKGSTYEEIWNTVLKAEKQYNVDEYMYEGFNKGITYWRLSLVPIFEESKIKYCIEMLIDITDQVLHRKKVEEQAKIIKDQKEELEEIIQSIDDAIFIFDKDNKCYIKNKAARSYSSDSNLEQDCDTCKSAEYFDLNNNKVIPEQMTIAKIQRGQIIKNYKLKMVQGDDIKYISVSGRPIYDPDKNMRLSILHTRDITEDINKESIIKEQQNLLLKREIEKNEMLERAMKMKDEFLSLISHEFRTPLNVINSAIQAMNYMCGNELSDKSRKYLDMIKQNTFRQLRLVNNLLDITRADAGCIKINKKNIDIAFLTKAIIESVHIYASQKGVSVTFISSLEKVVGIDDEKYERILLNLLSNAIKFTPKGKSIVVSLYSKKGSICVEVKDNGIGIPPNKIDIIFERFGQVDSSLSRQAEGTGIGLSLIKKFVEALGGSISVKSKVGRGSTFTIVLPREAIVEAHNEKEMVDLLDNRLIQTTSVEFSDIYL